MNQQEALEKLQQEELDMLVVLRQVCEQIGVPWFLDSGSALGAARHQGFIPWDDDIDVGMLRDDYERFLREAPSVLPEGYSLHTFDNTHGFAGMFAKLYRDGTEFVTQETLDAGCEQGIFIDIFPYDALAIDPKQRRQQIRNVRISQYLSYLYHSGHIVVPHKGLLGKLEKAACRCAHVIVHAVCNRERIRDRFNKSILPKSQQSGDLIIFAWAGMQPLTKDLLYPTKKVEFCGQLMPAPNQLARYLEKMYGNWQALPKLEDRRTHLPLLLSFSDGTAWKNVDAGAV